MYLLMLPVSFLDPLNPISQLSESLPICQYSEMRAGNTKDRGGSWGYPNFRIQIPNRSQKCAKDIVKKWINSPSHKSYKS
jgi:hypothetical protein